ncbi:biliverdin-producing heme oxygenase [Salegentibacter chungangensis]|uniref:Biliverdin-producing heme oxygenase n=1 Tax=Salegentibacter chungangensis TaxID=1335724 RepID=A0ABW3NVB0_9FLAO
MINRLREDTASLHKQIEKDNLASRIMDHKISLEEYKLLLLQNYLAYSIVEDAISPYYKSPEANRVKRLQRDLFNLNIDPTEALVQFQDAFKCTCKSEALGAAYVIEGSALGGMFIAKELENCEQLKEIEEHHFFNGDRNNVKPWNRFLKDIKSEAFTQDEEDRAAEKAKETFSFFGDIFTMDEGRVDS